ncbi:MAG: glycosyl hydrolase [Deltaproteobacteria bacterium]|nr:glycosyl hydrolase [Deltaproteobacteria bacterium]
MTPKVSKKSPAKKASFKLQVIPETILEGDPILVRGTGWDDRPTTIMLGGSAAKMERILQGYPVPGGVRPDGTGTFVVRIAAYGLKPGRYELRVSAGRQTPAVVRIELLRRKRPSAEEAEGDVNLAYWRSLAAFERRFAHIGYIPAGVRLAQVSSIQALRRALTPRRPEDTVPRGPDRPDISFFTRPVPGGCNWTPLGPAPIVAGSATSSFPAESGRVRSIAIDPTMPNRIYLGTANAGVWKSEDSGLTWSPKSDDQPSLAIGALAIDPNTPKRVFAGTGEYHQGFLANAYYGLGLLYSDDFGESWTPLAAATFERVEISRILFDPNNTANHMFLACDAGVYESITGGTSWNLLRAGSASDLVLRVMGGALQLIAAFHSQGVFTSTLSGGTWSPWIQIASPAFPASFGRIALGQSKINTDHIWAAFGGVSGSLAGIAKSTNGGGQWTSVDLAGLPLNAIYGLYYNLFVAIHPATPSTIFLGTNRLFRTDTGDAPWTEVTGTTTKLHVDHHAFAFDPVNPIVVYDCSDGGVYRSDDGGTNWDQRNRDLATLQFYHITNQPQWPAVLLGGTQDNGGVFYTAAPAWKIRQWPPGITFNGIEGDIVVTAIEPLMPSRMYFGRGIPPEIRRSDNGGRLWSAPKYTFSGSYEWNFPFVVDPASAGVCYTGGNTLVRSDNAGDTWTTITPALTGNITTIAVHPADSNIVYICTSQGKVYRVQRTGLDWTLPNVTTTDITGPPLPAGLYISCVAVDTAGTVWVSFSSVLMTELPGEFTNDHIYRLLAGSSTWENRSAGLAQANPINTITIDPKDNNVVFCGGDVGVFRWNAALSKWELWDHGLPNAPVFHLTIHNPSRLLRAATFGRGVWERPIDTMTCPDVDIYMRDNILDTGRGPAPSGVPHPLDPANLVWWFQSEDIKVDAPPFQTPMPVTDHVALANEIEHRNPRRGMTNRFYVQVHNRGSFKATNVRVRAFFDVASLGLANLPADFWAAGKPFDADPSAVSWAPVGSTQNVPELEPGETAVVSWDWVVPMSAAENSCLLALATCAEDPLNAMGVLYVSQLVTEQNNVTLKNLIVVR